MGFHRKSEAEIIDEFNRINLWREQKVWYKDPNVQDLEAHPDFAISQPVLVNNRFRKPHLVSFSFNNTDYSYNSSTISLNGLQFLALEAPSKESVKAFRNLLHNQHVRTVVCLTPAFEGNSEKCYPYWKAS